MKHTLLLKLACAATVGIAALACNQALATNITYNFMENGHGALPDNPETFSESGYTLTAWGYAIASPSNTLSGLYAKYTSGNPGETGLGMVVDSGGNNEIDSSHFVQFDSHIGLGTNLPPPPHFGSIWIGSVQTNEVGYVYGSNSQGTLGTYLIGELDGSNGMVQVTPWDLANYRYISVTGGGTAGGANVVINSLVAQVPDSGTTGLLLGLGLLGLGLAAVRRRKATVKS